MLKNRVVLTGFVNFFFFSIACESNEMGYYYFKHQMQHLFNESFLIQMLIIKSTINGHEVGGEVADISAYHFHQ